MGFLSKHVILTANEYGPRQIIHLPQNDSGRELVCEIGDMEIPRGSTARFWAAKPSRKVIYNDCTVQENQVIIPLKNQTLAEAGLVTAQVEIQNAGNLVKTFCFFLEVEKEAGSTGTESANESTYLEQYLEELQAQLTEAITESLGKVAQAISATEESSKHADQAAKRADDVTHSILDLNTERNLAEIFSVEISKFSDIWAWIKSRIQDGNYYNIHVGDYIPIIIDNVTLEMQVAGIDVYTGATDNSMGHHIDFISRDCYGLYSWNDTEDNNGNADSPYPYMICNLRRWLNETLYISLPQEIKNQIVPKRALMEQRYSNSGTLTESTAWGWQDIGMLWVPSEYEVFGACIWGTKGWSSGSAIQYPIFSNSSKSRIKRAETGRYDWWLATAASGHDGSACSVNADGSPAGYWYTSNYAGVPVCFRITQ